MKLEKESSKKNPGSSAPTARLNLAQGDALGVDPILRGALKGRFNSSPPRLKLQGENMRHEAGKGVLEKEPWKLSANGAPQLSPGRSPGCRPIFAWSPEGAIQFVATTAQT